MYNPRWREDPLSCQRKIKKRHKTQPCASGGAINRRFTTLKNFVNLALNNPELLTLNT